MISTNTSTPLARRSRLFRCSALLWAVVFLLSGVRSAYAEIECPHHADAAHHAADAAAGHAHAADHSLHHAHAQDHAEPAEQSPGSEPHHDFCTCVGPCHLAGLTPLPTATPGSPGAEILPLQATPTTLGTEPLPGRPSYSLPFATAPPRGS